MPSGSNRTEQIQTMIYAAFTFWLLMIMFTSMGVYSLWARMIRPNWLNWALLPGTIVSEMAYIFGCLITGGEIRRAKLIPPAPKKDAPDGEPITEATAGMTYIGPIVAALISIVACVAVILLAHTLLGKPVIREFSTAGGLLSVAGLPKEPASSWDMFWEHLTQQISLLRRMCEAYGNVNWLDWRVPVFVYFSGCMAIRLCPGKRPLRPSLVAAGCLAAVIALIGLIWQEFAGLMNDLWPLLTYIWTSLLFALTVTLMAKGAIAFVRVLMGKTDSFES